MSAPPDLEPHAPKPVPKRKPKNPPPSFESDAQRLLRPEPERFSLGQVIGRGAAWVGQRFGSHPLRQRGGYPTRLLAVPPALWRGDAARGAQVARGQLICPDFELNTQTTSFADARGSEAALSWLHGFAWLADLSAAYEAISAAPLAERLIKLWLADGKRYGTPAWTPEVSAMRVINWLAHAPLLLASNDQVYRSAVLTALGRFAKHLHAQADKAPDGMPRLTAIVGLGLAGLMIPGREASESKAQGLLAGFIDRHILPDGGFSTRCPQDLHTALRLLLTLRAGYRTRGVATPDSLQGAIDRSVPALKGLVLGEGSLARFNGGAALTQSEILETLSIADSGAKALRNGAHSGFQRLEAGRAVLVMDVGPPPTGPALLKAHAGALSFEFADAAQPLFINCGSDAEHPSLVSPALRAAVRRTAAHTTLTLAGQDQTLFAADGRLGKGITEVVATRQENEQGSWLDGAHDGYAARFGLRHRRRLFLKANGMDLRGEDRLEPVRSVKAAGPFRIDVRFHLAPAITAVATQGGAGVALKLPSGAAWMFRAQGAVVTLEESIAITRAGSRKTMQIVLSAAATAQGGVVIWSLRRQPK
jgi:uncharacterized heparinase superfamily protein